MKIKHRGRGLLAALLATAIAGDNKHYIDNDQPHRVRYAATGNSLNQTKAQRKKRKAKIRASRRARAYSRKP